MLLKNQAERHCLKVLKVYDWVTRPVDLQVKKILEEQPKFVKDEVCGNIGISCGETSPVWEAADGLSVSGSVTVFHHTGCEQMEVIVNGSPSFLLKKGETQTRTFQRLQSVEVRCIGGSGVCIGKYCLTLNYNLGKSCFKPGDCQLICFLSDKCGIPTDSLLCQEIPQPKGRKAVELLLPNGKTALLQKVKIVKKGFITINVISKGKVLCKLCTLPFAVAEKFYLCAPSGTFIECEITDFECEAQFLDECKTILVSISFCQDVQAVANVKIAMEAQICSPRSDMGLDVCPPHSPKDELCFPF